MALVGLDYLSQPADNERETADASYSFAVARARREMATDCGVRLEGWEPEKPNRIFDLL